jgi:hypothetical protein
LKLTKIIFAAAALTAFVVITPTIAKAQSTGQLAATATVTSSATLTLSDNSGPARSLTFTGTGGEAGIAATEGAITVGAQVTTAAENASTVIQTTSDVNLVGAGTGIGEDAIPFADLTYTASDAGGPQTATWLTPALGGGATVWSTLAELTPGSGTYAGTQTFNLAIPTTAVVDTYTGNVYYKITGF